MKVSVKWLYGVGVVGWVASSFFHATLRLRFLCANARSHGHLSHSPPPWEMTSASLRGPLHQLERRRKAVRALRRRSVKKCVALFPAPHLTTVPMPTILYYLCTFISSN